MRSARLIFFILLFIPVIAGAQDTLFMLNGNTITGKIREINPDTMFLLIQPVTKHKTKIENINLGSIYAISFKDSSRIIIYARDTARGIDYTPEQMGSYLRGGYYAKKHYKSPLILAGGIVAGFGGPYLQFFWGLLVPAAYCTIASVTPVHYAKQATLRPDLFRDPYFVEGYKDKAKKKKIINTIMGGAIGIGACALTVTTLYLINKNKK